MTDLALKPRKTTVKKKIDRGYNPYRLNRVVEPSLYTIELEPDLKHFTFSGREWITTRAHQPLNKIVLHALDIKITKAEVWGQGGCHQAARIAYNKELETVELEFRKTLKPEEVQTLYLEFEGLLNNHLHGFYRTRYEVKGEKLWGAATQFEATDARRAFPCWDEPDIKAEFEVTLRVPRDLVALSNMPVVEEHILPGSQLKKVVYQKTPRMSTYLLAFVIADLEYLEARDKHGVLIRVWTTPGKKEQGRFALEVALHTLPYFHEWFGIPYALPKLDMVSLPDFASGAMENWGLVTYRETALLIDPKQSSAAARQRVAEVIDHELAHQWFGNLVTMKWWTDLWLNEGFASYMGPKAVDHQFPVWRVWDQYFAGECLAALKYDSLKHTHPIEIPVKNPHEIREIFDHITYSKGSVLNRMLEHYLGEEEFREGLQHYLTFHAYGNARTQDLWEVLEKTSGKPIRSLMNGYTRQGGYPLLMVQGRAANSKGSLSIQQKRFLFDGRTDPKNPRWDIPVSIINAGEKRPRAFLVKKYRAVVNLPRKVRRWVKVNAGQSGFYRVFYPNEMLKRLNGAIRTKALSVIDSLGVVDDASALTRAGYLRTPQLMEVIESCRSHRDYNIWFVVSGILGEIENLFCSDAIQNNLDLFARSLFQPLAAKIGWTEKQSENHLDILLRSLVIGNLGHYGDPKTVKEARRRFSNFIQKGNLPPNLRASVFGITARYGGDDEFKKLLRVYNETELQEEKVRILRALTRFRPKDIVQKVLKFSLSPNVRVQDAYILLAGFGSNGTARMLAWDFIKAKWKIMVNRYSGGGVALLARALEAVTSHFTSRSALNDVSHFFRTHPLVGAERTMKQCLEMIRSNVAWVNHDHKDLSFWLGNRAGCKNGKIAMRSLNIMCRINQKKLIIMGSFLLVSALTLSLSVAGPATSKTEDSNNVFEAHQVGAQADAKSPDKDHTSSETKPAKAVEDEPNFISVDGKVIPNPRKKNASNTGGAEEPNYVVINGQVVRNPNKKEIS